jgi:hypothetical protein
MNESELETLDCFLVWDWKKGKSVEEQNLFAFASIIRFGANWNVLSLLWQTKSGRYFVLFILWKSVASEKFDDRCST